MSTPEISGVGTVKRESGPRLRCTDDGPNCFYVTYRGHQVAVERDHRSSPWSFLVVCPDGIRAADGVMREPATKREAIIHALSGALLWTPKQRLSA